jgi:hypothetical protein
MPNIAELIERYVLSKDCNRPHLLEGVFTREVALIMDVRTPNIVFPKHAEGLESVSGIVCRRLNQRFENIYTFCFALRPASLDQHFACGWLVVMSEKDGGDVRAGGGRYDWHLTADLQRVAALRITVSVMDTLMPEALPSVMAWSSRQGYPWCDRTRAEESATAVPALHATLLKLREAYETQEDVLPQQRFARLLNWS